MSKIKENNYKYLSYYKIKISNNTKFREGIQNKCIKLQI